LRVPIDNCFVSSGVTVTGHHDGAGPSARTTARSSFGHQRWTERWDDRRFKLMRGWDRRRLLYGRLDVVRCAIRWMFLSRRRSSSGRSLFAVPGAGRPAVALTAAVSGAPDCAGGSTCRAGFRLRPDRRDEPDRLGGTALSPLRPAGSTTTRVRPRPLARWVRAGALHRTRAARASSLTQVPRSANRRVRARISGIFIVTLGARHQP